MAQVSHLWKVIEAWRDQQQFPPNQSKLAEWVGVERSAVSDWKSGKTRPTPSRIGQLVYLMTPTFGRDAERMLLRALLIDMGYLTDRPKDLEIIPLTGDWQRRRGDYELAARRTRSGGPSAGQRKRKAFDDLGEDSQDPDDD